MLLKRWFEDTFTNKGKLNSIYDKINKFETDYKNQYLELKKSENMYKRLFESKQAIDRIFSVLIDVSAAISDGSIRECHLEKTAIIMQRAFTITEIYYAEFLGNKFHKIRNYVCEELIDAYIPNIEVDINDIPDFVEYIKRGECYQVNNNEFSNEESIYYNKIGIKSTYGCPVKVDDKLYGVVGFNKTEPTIWSNEEIAICKIFSSLISMYIKRKAMIEALTIVEEDKLRQCELITSTMSMVQGFMWNKDKEGGYRFCSPSFKTVFFGLPQDADITGKTDMELLNAFRTTTGKVHTFGDICVGTDGHCKNQGTTCYYVEFGYIGDNLFALDVVKTPQYDKQGNYTGIVGIARDRSKDAEILDLMLEKYKAEGRVISLNPDRLFIDRVAAYWIKDEVDHRKLLKESTIIPR